MCYSYSVNAFLHAEIFQEFRSLIVPELQHGPEKSKWKRGTFVGNDGKDMEDSVIVALLDFMSSLK